MGDATPPSKLLPLLTWRAAICDSELAATTRHVALTLSLYMNERGTSAFPGAPRLVHDTGLAERSVRAHLGILVERGWLDLVERGGIKGGERRANHYRAATPAFPAPMQLTAFTPASDDTDPGSTCTPTLQDLSMNSGDNGASAVPDLRIQELVAGYVEDFQSERQGHKPQPSWRGAAGKAAKTALAAGETVEDIAGCFQVIAHEGKNPSVLPYVLADSHAGRERRPVR